MALEDAPSIAAKPPHDDHGGGGGGETVTSNGADDDDSHAPAKQLMQEIEAQKARVKELEEELARQREEKDALQRELGEVKTAAESRDKEAEERLRQVAEERDDLGAQYRSLLDRVSTIKEKMGEKLKADAEALAQSRNTVVELEEQNRQLNDALDDLRTEYRKLNEESTDAVREAANLRTRLNLSQQNWQKERDELVGREKHLRQEYDTATQAMQDWEVIAMEERSLRESLAERVVELEEQLATMKSGFERAVADRNKESATIDSLQRALHEIQEARKVELREIIENMQGQIDKLTADAQTMKQRATEAEAELKTTRENLEKFQHFEKEVKEKNLLIGKLRHEAVTLNDHLTKALRMLQRGNASDNVDKQLVTNVFLSFLSIQRGDTKKYEVLQLIASVLGWNDEQRERAGLVRPGASSSSHHTASGAPPPATSAAAASFSRATSPMMPFARSPSTPSLSDPYEGNRELWSSVLDSPHPSSSSHASLKPY